MNYAFLGLVILSPFLAEAAPRTIAELANFVINIINGGIGLALTLAIVIYFYGLATNITSLSKGDASKWKAHVLWGLIAIFVLFSVWGIVGLLRNTLFGGGAAQNLGGRSEVFCNGPDDCPISR